MKYASRVTEQKRSPGSRVLGVLAGRDMPSPLLRRWLDSADIVLAADGGADFAIESGRLPDIVVGDLDSIAAATIAGHHDVRHERGQDDTDVDKLLSLAQSEGFPDITLVGTEGDRPDHVIATLHSAAKAPIGVRLAYRQGIGFMIRPGASFAVDLPPSRRVSLLPVTVCHGVSLSGVRWPLRSVTIDPVGQTSISNESQGDASVSVAIEHGVALLYVGLVDEEMPYWHPDARG